MLWKVFSLIINSLYSSTNAAYETRWHSPLRNYYQKCTEDCHPYWSSCNGCNTSFSFSHYSLHCLRHIWTSDFGISYTVSTKETNSIFQSKTPQKADQSRISCFRNLIEATHRHSPFFHSLPVICNIRNNHRFVRFLKSLDKLPLWNHLYGYPFGVIGEFLELFEAVRIL